LPDWTDDDDVAFLRARRHEAELRQSAERHPARPFDQDNTGSVVGAHTIGALAMVDVGWSVWSRTAGNIRHIRLNHQGEARGGVVVDITARRIADPDTGEVRTERAFRCVDPYACPQLAWATLTEDHIDPAVVEIPNQRRRWVVILALLQAAIGAGRPLDLARTEADRTDLIGHAYRLARTGGPR
jgi:hypothetical protein